MSQCSIPLTLTSVIVAILTTPVVTAEEPVVVGQRREIFVDYQLIDNLKATTLRMHHPQPAETVLHFDKPWEGAFCGYVTVIDTRDGRYRMYYRGLPASGRDGSDSEVTCYAESNDGIHWRKPNLRVYEIDGSKDNNVVLSGQTPASHNFSPFLDSNPDTKPEQKYKALGGNDKGLIAFVSPDGIHWIRAQKEPVFFDGVFDSQNVSFWSDAEQQYVCYFRTWSEGGYRGFRTISRTTSPDFLNWSDPQVMNFGDRPLEHLYTNQTHPYARAPHIYVGIAARFMPGRQVITDTEAAKVKVDPKYFGDCSDAVLLTTRGGNRYDRTFMESFIRPGFGLQNWVSRTNYPVLGILETGTDQLSIYIQRNYGQPTSHIRRFTLRIDGFASINAPYSGGEMITKPLSFTSDSGLISKRQLELNFATSAAGMIRVELQNAAGETIAGYSADDCDPLIGDHISRAVSWQGKTDLSQLVATPLRLRFVMHDADLYALQVP